MIRSFRVHGRVQGVGFRWFVREHAIRLGLDGSVENLPDGSVLVQVSGDESGLDTVARLIAEGPPNANVTKVETLENKDEICPAKGFRIVR